MFLAPFALTIFGFSTSSASKVRFSRGASTGAASCLVGFAGFLAGFASAPTGTAVSAAGVSAVLSALASAAGDFSSASGFFGLSAFSAFGFAGFLFSAILIKLCLLLLPDCGSRRRFCAVLCACARLSMFADRGRASRDGDVGRGNN